MKKKLIYPLLIFFFLQVTHVIQLSACSCSRVQSFWEIYQNNALQDSLVKVVKLDDYYWGMHVKVIEKPAGCTVSDTLAVWGINLTSCRWARTAEYNNGDTLLYLLHKTNMEGNGQISGSDVSPNVEQPGDYQLSPCVCNILRLKNGVAFGQISDDITSLPVDSLYSLLATSYTATVKHEFAPIGAEWYYTKAESYNPPVFGYLKHKCIKDSIIDGQTVKVIEISYAMNSDTSHTLGHEYLLQKGDTIYCWKSGEFHLLYNFASQKGDSILLYSEMPNQCVEQTNYGWSIVDTTYTSVINGIELKTYMSSPYRGSIWGWGELGLPIIETIGSLDYLYPQNAFCGVYDGLPQWGSLRCYSDDSLGFFNFSAVYSCDSTTNYPDGVELLARQHLLKLYPNPATDRIFVEFEKWQNIENPVILLYDIIGNLKIQTDIHAFKTAFDLSGMIPGNYVLIVKSNEKMIDYEEFIKR